MPSVPDLYNADNLVYKHMYTCSLTTSRLQKETNTDNEKENLPIHPFGRL